MEDSEEEDYWAERKRILDDFGTGLAKLRAPHSQEGFAKLEDVRLHRNEIGKLERGEHEPGVLTLLILAAALDKDSLYELMKSLPVPRKRRPPRPRRDSVDP
jgi:transcriptional regulator with XRE-family HTH domain